MVTPSLPRTGITQVMHTDATRHRLLDGHLGHRALGGGDSGDGSAASPSVQP